MFFKLGTKFSEPCGTRYTDKDGTQKTPVMGCYGIGPSRVMGTVAECLSDDKGLIWPEEIAPFKVHLVSLARTDEEITQCEDIYNNLQTAGIDVLYDDRPDASAGAKLADSDLLGIPNRLVVSKKTLAGNSVEWKKRNSDEIILLPIENLVSSLKN